MGTLSAESSAAVRSSSAAAIAITVSSHSIGAPRAVWRARGLVDGHHPWTDRGLTLDIRCLLSIPVPVSVSVPATHFYPSSGDHTSFKPC
eukprot:COSAG06_NODE_929_length_11465_cov_4.106722_1_plen_89_part_10